MSDNSPVNLKDVCENLMDDAEMTEQLFASFLKSLPDRISQLKTYQESQDHEALKSEAHKLKGTSANMGAYDLSQMAKSLENSLDDGASSEESIQQTLDEINAEYEKILSWNEGRKPL